MTISEARRLLPQIAAEVAAEGERIDITRHGEPLVSLVPTASLHDRTTAGAGSGSQALRVDFFFEPAELPNMIRELRGRIGRPRAQPSPPVDRALEEAREYRRLRDEGRSFREISAMFGLSVGHIHGRLQLLELGAPALAALKRGQIALNVATLLAAYREPRLQIAALARVRQRGAPMHARAAKRALEQFDEERHGQRGKRRRSGPSDARS